jgi:methionine-rich copper-binding protein CopC
MIFFFTNCHSRAWAELHRTICRRISAFLIKLLLLVLFAVLPHGALAHSQLLKAEPAPGATLRQSPSEIRLTFSEPVSPDATLTLSPQGSFTAIAGITAQQQPDHPEQIFASLPALEAGAYTVQWQVKSSDGHSLTGSYSFAVNLNSTASILQLALFFTLFLLLFGLARRTLKSRTHQTPFVGK